MEKTRITINLDGDIFKKIRNIQSKRISATATNISFSKIVNDHLRDCLKIKQL